MFPTLQYPPPPFFSFPLPIFLPFFPFSSSVSPLDLLLLRVPLLFYRLFHVRFLPFHVTSSITRPQQFPNIFSLSSFICVDGFYFFPPSISFASPPRLAFPHLGVFPIDHKKLIIFPLLYLLFFFLHVCGWLTFSLFPVLFCSFFISTFCIGFPFHISFPPTLPFNIHFPHSSFMYVCVACLSFLILFPSFSSPHLALCSLFTLHTFCHHIFHFYFSST